MNETKIPGTHGFSAPRIPDRYITPWETFSIGVFEWAQKANGEGVKRGKRKVLVTGYLADVRNVEAQAREIAEQLDAGTYQGKTNVFVYLEKVA